MTHVLEIITAPDHVLRTVATAVDHITEKHQALIDAMRKLMIEHGGIGLAATQVGIHERIIVIDVELVDVNDVEYTQHGSFDMINPVIISRQGSMLSSEGCLSVPGFTGDIERSSVIEVEFLDKFGEKRTITASGLLSACIQHEIDHLDGKLFVDRLSKIKKDMIMSKLKKTRRSLFLR